MEPARKPGRFFEFSPETAKVVLAIAMEHEDRDYIVDITQMSNRDLCLIAHATATRAFNPRAQREASPVVRDGLHRIRDFIGRESVPTRPIQVVDWDHPRTRRAVAQLERERAR